MKQPYIAKTPAATERLLAAIEEPFDIARHGQFEEHHRAGRIHLAARELRAAMADDEYASWQVLPHARMLDPREFLVSIGVLQERRQ